MVQVYLYLILYFGIFFVVDRKHSALLEEKRNKLNEKLEKKDKRKKKKKKDRNKNIVDQFCTESGPSSSRYIAIYAFLKSGNIYLKR